MARLDKTQVKTLKNAEAFSIKVYPDICLIDAQKPLLNSIKWPEEEYYIKWNEPPNNTEKNYWNKVLKIEEKFPPSKITRGRQVGRTIGIPTANLTYEERDIFRKGLCPGVYCGRCTLFVNQESIEKYDFIEAMQPLSLIHI